jgi:hypothetical protein
VRLPEAGIAFTGDMLHELPFVGHARFFDGTVGEAIEAAWREIED